MRILFIGNSAVLDEIRQRSTELLVGVESFIVPDVPAAVRRIAALSVDLVVVQTILGEDDREILRVAMATHAPQAKLITWDMSAAEGGTVDDPSNKVEAFARQVRDVLEQTSEKGLLQETQHRRRQQPVLVLEDDLSLQRLYTKSLRQVGLEVYAADSLEKAEMLLEAWTFSVFVCDILIGDELAIPLLRAHSKDLRDKGTQIVAISGFSEYRALCDEMEIDFYLEKPVAMEHLATLVQRLLPLEENV